MASCREQGLELRALVWGQLRFAVLDGPDAGEAKVRPGSLDLANLCRDLPEIHGIGVEVRREVELGNSEVRAPLDRFTVEICLQPLKAPNLLGGEVQLLPVSEHVRDERALAVPRSVVEVFTPTSSQAVEVSDEFVQGSGQLLMGYWA